MFLAKDEDGKFPIVEKMIEVTDTAVTSFDDAAEGVEQRTSRRVFRDHVV